MNLTFETACIRENKIIFPAREYNMLYQFDLDKNEIAILDGYEQRFNADELMFGAMSYIDGKIVLAPLFSHNFLIYDFQTKEYNEIPIPFCDKYEDLYFCSILCKNDVYFFPGFADNIAIYHHEDGRITYENKIISDLRKLIGKDGRLFRRMPVFFNHSILIPCDGTKYIFKYDLSNKNWNLIYGKDKTSFITLCSDGNRCFALSTQGEIFSINKEFEIKLLYRFEIHKDILFGEIAICEEKLMVFPYGSQEIIYIDITKKEDYRYSLGKVTSTLFTLENEKYIYALLTNGIGLLQISKTDSMQISRISICDTAIDGIPFEIRYKAKDNLYFEEDQRSLDFFLKYVE